jgi:hypothetical protein
MEAAGSSDRWNLALKLHGATSQKTRMFTFTTDRPVFLIKSEFMLTTFS